MGLADSIVFACVTAGCVQFMLPGRSLWLKLMVAIVLTLAVQWLAEAIAK
jgi:hypothetical protein